MPERKLRLQERLVTSPAQAALSLKLVSEMDLLRLKAVARLHARGLPADVGWADLLQEAFARVLDGSRKKPEGLGLVAFLAGVMRSLKTDHWRRALRESRDPRPAEWQAGDPGSDPERAMSALQELAAIDQLFADDPVVRRIIAGLGEGLSAEQIRSTMGISATEYESARKRMRRALLRKGLTCSQE